MIVVSSEEGGQPIPPPKPVVDDALIEQMEVQVDRLRRLAQSLKDAVTS